MKRSATGVWFHQTKWNIFAIHPWRTVWMLMPKAASTSIRHALAHQLGLPTGAVHHLMEFQGLDQQDALRLQHEHDYLVVGSVRHPAARLASCWFDKVSSPPYYREFTVYDQFAPGMPFDAFVKAVHAISDEDAEPHFRSLSFDLVSDDRVIPDLLVDPATLASDWNKVRAHVAWRTHPHIWLPSLPHSNRTDAERHMPVLTGATRTLIEQRYAADYAHFGYPTNDSED